MAKEVKLEWLPKDMFDVDGVVIVISEFGFLLDLRGALISDERRTISRVTFVVVDKAEEKNLSVKEKTNCCSSRDRFCMSNEEL